MKIDIRWHLIPQINKIVNQRRMAKAKATPTQIVNELIAEGIRQHKKNPGEIPLWT